MDVYVRQFGISKNHDEFYTNETIIALFKNYTTNIVSRYVNSPAVFGWELANDPRCSSTLGASTTCTPQTVTKWHSTLAQHVASVDPNHIITSGYVASISNASSANSLTGIKDSSVQVALSYSRAPLHHPNPSPQLNFRVFAVASYSCQ